MSTSNPIGIIATGHYLPKNHVTNQHFVDRGLDTTTEWISSRSGINGRYIAADHESTSDLGAHAARMAINSECVDHQSIDFIIVATATPDHVGFPSTACLIQEKLNLTRSIECMDITAACSGFTMGLALAYAKIHAGLGKYGLVIGAETLSRLVDWSDRRTCILFGDGAGAAVVGPVTHGGFKGFDQGADGRASTILKCTPKEYSKKFNSTEHPPFSPIIEMDGQAVFKKGVQTVVESINQLLNQTGTKPSAIDHVICHQANQRILNTVAKQLAIPSDKFVSNISRVGNTSAASIPIALSESVQSNTLQKGDNLVLSGFGSGFTWSSILLEWQ